VPCASEDANFYIILSLRNFNRGPPMLPADSQDSVSMSISGGEPWCGLSGYFRAVFLIDSI